MNELYIGLMSGTSADGIDAAVVDFGQAQPTVLATHYTPYSPELRKQILALCQQGENEIQRLGELDVILGRAFANAVQHLLKDHGISATAIKAIGSHGQTIRHYPHLPYRFTMQIGDPNIIAANTGITTIADFRRKDIAYGGQGAPLVPAFHQYMFASKTIDRAIVNIGGMANVTLLPKQQTDNIIGFDTGPGNVLIDAWIFSHQQLTHDQHGAWGRDGNIHAPLLQRLLDDAYFKLAPPKSTGREYFHLPWLTQHLQSFNNTISPIDVQATLVELTALSIINTIKDYFAAGEILICGGGAHNTYLMSRLATLGKNAFIVASTEAYGVSPDWVEAMAFAWLAKQTLHRHTGNIPSVTGAMQAAILGGIYY